MSCTAFRRIVRELGIHVLFIYFSFSLQRKGFLLKWKNYPIWQSTFEPKINLNLACLRSYHLPPRPAADRLEAITARFLCAVQRKLACSRNASGQVVVSDFDLDIFRWVFLNQDRKLKRGWLLCEENDFHRLSLPAGWFKARNKYGSAISIRFPVRVRGHLKLFKCSAFEMGCPIESLRLFFAVKGGE